VWIGGDFMGGRFFTVPFLLGMLVIAERIQGIDRSWALGPIAALAFLALSTFDERRVDRQRTDCSIAASGIVDERECYVQHTGLAQNIRTKKWKTHGYLNDFRKAVERDRDGVVVFDLVGMATWGSSERVHILERYALSDPLLARLKFRSGEGWRPGHLFRHAPMGYEESLVTGTNKVVDPCVRALHDDLKLITAGPIFSAERFGAILRRNFGNSTCRS
jgi:arabinofuranosyltransferase